MEQREGEAKDVLEFLLNLVQRCALLIWHLLVYLKRYNHLSHSVAQGERAHVILAKRKHRHKVRATRRDISTHKRYCLER
jgi:hypothetical protein